MVTLSFLTDENLYVILPLRGYMIHPKGKA